MALYEVPPGEREGINIHSRFPGGMRSCLRSCDVSRGWLDLRLAGRVSISGGAPLALRKLAVPCEARLTAMPIAGAGGAAMASAMA